MKQWKRLLVLFTTGGTAYILIEMLWRAWRGTGATHWTMFLLGGVCFLLCGMVNEVFSWDMAMWKQQAICAVLITAAEFISGYVLNIVLGLHIWDYSNVPLNLCGQVCLPFSIAWFFLAIPAILLDDTIRWMMGGEKPRYKWL